jgi:hypothetical protein
MIDFQEKHTTILDNKQVISFIVQADGLPGRTYVRLGHMHENSANLTEREYKLLPKWSNDPEGPDYYYNIFHIPGVKSERLIRNTKDCIRVYKFQKPEFRKLNFLLSYNPDERYNGNRVFHYYLLDENLHPVSFENLKKYMKQIPLKNLAKS